MPSVVGLQPANSKVKIANTSNSFLYMGFSLEVDWWQIWDLQRSLKMNEVKLHNLTTIWLAAAANEENNAGDGQDDSRDE